MRWQIMFWARDAVWATGKWKTPQLDEFIKSVNPDIIFQPIYYSSFVDEVGLYAKKLTGAPMVGYISDDCYTLRQFSLSPLFWIDRLWKRRYVKRAIDECMLLYVITDRQKANIPRFLAINANFYLKVAISMSLFKLMRFRPQSNSYTPVISELADGKHLPNSQKQLKM